MNFDHCMGYACEISRKTPMQRGNRCRGDVAWVYATDFITNGN